MIKRLLISIMLLFPLFSLGQGTSFTIRIQENNRSGQGMNYVNISSTANISRELLGNGRYRITVRNRVPGDRMEIILSLPGYEVVNLADLKFIVPKEGVMEIEYFISKRNTVGNYRSLHYGYPNKDGEMKALRKTVDETNKLLSFFSSGPIVSKKNIDVNDMEFKNAEADAQAGNFATAKSQFNLATLKADISELKSSTNELEIQKNRIINRLTLGGEIALKEDKIDSSYYYFKELYELTPNDLTNILKLIGLCHIKDEPEEGKQWSLIASKVIPKDDDQKIMQMILSTVDIEFDSEKTADFLIKLEKAMDTSALTDRFVISVAYYCLGFGYLDSGDEVKGHFYYEKTIQDGGKMKYNAYKQLAQHYVQRQDYQKSDSVYTIMNNYIQALDPKEKNSPSYRREYFFNSFEQARIGAIYNKDNVTYHKAVSNLLDSLKSPVSKNYNYIFINYLKNIIPIKKEYSTENVYYQWLALVQNNFQSSNFAKRNHILMGYLNSELADFYLRYRYPSDTVSKYYDESIYTLWKGVDDIATLTKFCNLINDYPYSVQLNTKLNQFVLNAIAEIENGKMTFIDKSVILSFLYDSYLNSRFMKSDIDALDKKLLSHLRKAFKNTTNNNILTRLNSAYGHFTGKFIKSNLSTAEEIANEQYLKYTNRLLLDFSNSDYISNHIEGLKNLIQVTEIRRKKNALGLVDSCLHSMIGKSKNVKATNMIKSAYQNEIYPYLLNGGFIDSILYGKIQKKIVQFHEEFRKDSLTKQNATGLAYQIKTIRDAYLYGIRSSLPRSATINDFIINSKKIIGFLKNERESNVDFFSGKVNQMDTLIATDLYSEYLTLATNFINAKKYDECLELCISAEKNLHSSTRYNQYYKVCLQMLIGHCYALKANLEKAISTYQNINETSVGIGEGYYSIKEAIARDMYRFRAENFSRDIAKQVIARLEISDDLHSEVMINSARNIERNENPFISLYPSYRTISITELSEEACGLADAGTSWKSSLTVNTGDTLRIRIYYKNYNSYPSDSLKIYLKQRKDPSEKDQIIDCYFSLNGKAFLMGQVKMKMSTGTTLISTRFATRHFTLEELSYPKTSSFINGTPMNLGYITAGYNGMIISELIVK